MIKDVMVWLDGGISDGVRLAAVADTGGALVTAELLDRAREAGDKPEALLAKRLALLERPVEIRRFDVLADDIANIAAREARSADTFVAVRPNGAMDPENLVEGVLFGSGRNLYLVPETERPK